MSNTKNLRVTGLTELLTKLESLSADSITICKSVAHSGADSMADTVKAQINSLKTTSDDDYGSSNAKRYCYQWEKDGLIESMGISPVQENGSKVDFKVGFDGYASGSKKTAKYPKGKANAMIAYSINAGTTFMQAQPFLKKAQSSGRAAALSAMEAELTTEINKYMS